ncbi:hypothetical protein HMN09_01117900 [Mycena chlorophos]|uniref:DNA breaking-rejoining enzyme n=1 Tax=Mycena chlorophos TaxID=658473 RepID=A0A8H6VVQ9_MYCCL|nr:hypothetical protein HMN09_01117900 [Mycena chlorophos]
MYRPSNTNWADCASAPPKWSPPPMRISFTAAFAPAEANGHAEAPKPQSTAHPSIPSHLAKPPHTGNATSRALPPSTAKADKNWPRPAPANPARPRKPKPGNEIAHSQFRPPVLAKNRLRQWSSPAMEAFKADLEARFLAERAAKMMDAIFDGFAPNTHETYASGLLRFHQYCDKLDIPEANRIPASTQLLLAFITEHIAEVGGGTVKSWMSGVKAMHDVCNAQWNGDERVIELARRTANKEGAIFSKPPRPPASIMHIVALCDNLDPRDPADAAVKATALTAFWGCRRLGELTIPSANSFDAKYHVQRSVQLHSTDLAFTFDIPWTKTTKQKGGTVVITKRDDKLCPVAALGQHYSANMLPLPNTPLFAFRGKDGAWCAMTKPYFLARCAAIWEKEGMMDLAGHSFRIGGSSELLMAGVAPEVVAAIGGWTSLAFLLYWRKLGHIIPKVVHAAYHKKSFQELAEMIEEFRRKNNITDTQLDQAAARTQLS